MNRPEQIGHWDTMPRAIEHFHTYEEAMRWARESAAIERCRYLVRYDAGRVSPKKWEAIMAWLRNL